MCSRRAGSFSSRAGVSGGRGLWAHSGPCSLRTSSALLCCSTGLPDSMAYTGTIHIPTPPSDKCARLHAVRSAVWGGSRPQPGLPQEPGVTELGHGSPTMVLLCWTSPSCLLPIVLGPSQVTACWASTLTWLRLAGSQADRAQPTRVVVPGSWGPGDPHLYLLQASHPPAATGMAAGLGRLIVVLEMFRNQPFNENKRN